MDIYDVFCGCVLIVVEVFVQIEQFILVFGIESDGFFIFVEQEEIVVYVFNVCLECIDSLEGYDVFLLQFEQVNSYVLKFLQEILLDIMGKEGDLSVVVEEEGVGWIIKFSIFGEVEVEDIIVW